MDRILKPLILFCISFSLSFGCNFQLQASQGSQNQALYNFILNRTVTQFNALENWQQFSQVFLKAASPKDRIDFEKIYQNSNLKLPQLIRTEHGFRFTMDNEQYDFKIINLELKKFSVNNVIFVFDPTAPLALQAEILQRKLSQSKADNVSALLYRLFFPEAHAVIHGLALGALITLVSSFAGGALMDAFSKIVDYSSSKSQFLECQDIELNALNGAVKDPSKLLEAGYLHDCREYIQVSAQQAGRFPPVKEQPAITLSAPTPTRHAVSLKINSDGSGRESCPVGESKSFYEGTFTLIESLEVSPPKVIARKIHAEVIFQDVLNAETNVTKKTSSIRRADIFNDAGLVVACFHLGDNNTLLRTSVFDRPEASGSAPCSDNINISVSKNKSHSNLDHNDPKATVSQKAKILLYGEIFRMFSLQLANCEKKASERIAKEQKKQAVAVKPPQQPAK